MKAAFLLCCLALYGQEFKINDRNGVPVFSIDKIKLFRYSDYFHREIADFACSIKNISGEKLDPAPITVTIHKKDRSVFVFDIMAESCGFPVCSLEPKATATAEHPLFDEPYTVENFNYVEFKLQDSWKSPEDKRIAIAAERKEEARIAAIERVKEAAAKRRRLTEETTAQKQREIEKAVLRRVLAARMAMEEKLHEEEARTCGELYKTTANKKIGDLTVKEEQSVRVCQSNGLYRAR